MIAESEDYVLRRTLENLVYRFRAELTTLSSGNTRSFKASTRSQDRRILREFGIIVLEPRYQGYKVSKFGQSLLHK